MRSRYDRTIGYSDLDLADPNKVFRIVQINKAVIDELFPTSEKAVILVAGAGTGLEALLVHQVFGSTTIGVDLNVRPWQRAGTHSGVILSRQDLNELGLSGASVNLVYCYHVLEHVLDPARALRELHRVLVPGGVLFVGFPNRHRLISYIGTSQKATVLDKLRWNMQDLGYRVRGRFRNEFGAHAGFAEAEFTAAASQLFNSVRSVRSRYMLAKYPAFSRLLNLVVRLGMDEVLFPSNYFVCVKDYAAGG